MCQGPHNHRRDMDHKSMREGRVTKGTPAWWHEKGPRFRQPPGAPTRQPTETRPQQNWRCARPFVVKQKKGGVSTHTRSKTPSRTHTLPHTKNIFGGDLLSHTPSGCSTISAKSLNYRVRNETGCTPLAITTEKTNHTHQPTHGAGMVKTNQTTHPQQVVVSKPYSEHEHTTIIYKPSQQPPNTPTTTRGGVFCV